MSRPLVRYHGGKWKLAPWIISRFPEHRIYVEPYGGGGSVLLRKERSYAEIYNDLDGEICNLFRVARDCGDALVRACELTPFARDEFVLSYEPSADTLEQARRTLARSFMGFGSAAASRKATGFRANSNRSGTTPAHDWGNYPKALEATVDRLRGVVIENRDALEVMAQQDSLETLFYVDPPYVSSTRDKGSDYLHEMTDRDHFALLSFLCDLKGMVVLSGYENPLYTEYLADWPSESMFAMADGAQPRKEVLWFNPAAMNALLKANGQLSLLEEFA